MSNLDKLKARISPGDSVCFAFRGQRLNGTVVALGPKRVGITLSSGECYRVPYPLIQPLGETKNYANQEQGVLKNARRLLRKHGLSDWSVALDDASSRAGACNYKSKQILLARLFLRKASESAIRDTILHEIAHALAGMAHHHDAVWRRIARGIGCSAARCHDIDFSPPRWIMQCPNGCFVYARKRRNSGMICKKCKQPPRFISWTKERALTLGLC